jgi:CRISPR-associated protein Cmr6
MTEQGTIKFYNSKGEYGFIIREGKKDVYFNRDSFEGDAPSKGDEVEFNVMQEQRGPHAKNIKKIIKSGENKYYLPSDTVRIFNPDEIDNFALKLNKTPLYIDEKFKFFTIDDKGNPEINILPDYSKLDIKAIAKKHEKSIEKLNLERKSIILKPEWRMIIGLGNESVYETSMTLHHIYGIPYIPGSAIKGVVRSYFIIELFGKDNNGSLDLEKAEERALKDKIFCDIFGCPENSVYNEARKGRIIFFDAFPLSNPKLKIDIMNPHFSPYYSDESKPPADYHEPIPIHFLTVENTEFEFIIGINKKENEIPKDERFKGKTPLEIAFQYIEEALKEHGIGAKTAVGYGYFDDIDS